MGGVIECVINEHKSPYLDRAGKTVGHTQGGGPTAYGVTLVQDRLHTQFYIDLWQQLTPPGDGFTWERRIGDKAMKPIALIVLAASLLVGGISISDAKADEFGGDAGGCGGYGSIGSTVGAGVGCAGSPTQPTPNQQTDPRAEPRGARLHVQTR